MGLAGALLAFARGRVPLKTSVKVSRPLEDQVPDAEPLVVEKPPDARRFNLFWVPMLAGFVLLLFVTVRFVSQSPFVRAYRGGFRMKGKLLVRMRFGIRVVLGRVMRLLSSRTRDRMGLVRLLTKGLGGLPGRRLARLGFRSKKETPWSSNWEVEDWRQEERDLAEQDQMEQEMERDLAEQDLVEQEMEQDLVEQDRMEREMEQDLMEWEEQERELEWDLVELEMEERQEDRDWEDW